MTTESPKPSPAALLNLPLTNPDLLEFGVGQVAYVRPIHIMNKNMFAVHAADGTPISVFDTETDALEAVAENDLQAVRIQ